MEVLTNQRLNQIYNSFIEFLFGNIRILLKYLTQIEFLKCILHNCIFDSAEHKFDVFSICRY